MINSTANYYSFQDTYNNIVYLFNFQTQKRAENFSFDFMKTVKTFIQKWFSIDLAFGIGTIAEDSGQIADSYQKALLALQYKTSQDSPIYRYSNNNHIFSPRFAGLDIYNRFLMALRQTSLEDAKEVLLEIEQQFLLQNSDMYIAQLLLSPLFSIILSFLSEKEININDVLDNDPVLYPNIFLKSSAHDSCDLLFHICQESDSAFWQFQAFTCIGNNSSGSGLYSAALYGRRVISEANFGKCCSGCQLYSENIQQIYEMHHYRLYTFSPNGTCQTITGTGKYQYYRSFFSCRL